MKLTKSKRLKFSIIMIIANFIFGSIGIHYGADLSELGVFILLANAPLYGYILGETYRPSINNE